MMSVMNVTEEQRLEELNKEYQKEFLLKDSILLPEEA